jgi:myosin heavy subunit
MLCGLVNVNAQNEVLDKIANQAVEINNLKIANKTLTLQITILNKNIKTNESSNDKLLQINLAKEKKQKKEKEKLNKEIEKLNKEIEKLDKYTSEKKAIEKELEAKNESIDELKKQITEKDNEINTITDKSKKEAAAEKESNKIVAAAEKERGKSEVINKLVNTYKNKSFDDLINSSSITSVQRDINIIDNNTDVKQIIADLEIYFIAENLFSKKFNESQVKNSLSQVTQIQQSKLVSASAAVVALKDNLDNFKSFNDGLNTAIQNIITIDKKEIVKGMSEDVVKLKLNKIISELSKFIFDYNFNFIDYPYLSEIVLEIIKRKQPNPDAIISDLLSKI